MPVIFPKSDVQKVYEGIYNKYFKDRNKEVSENIMFSLEHIEDNFDVDDRIKLLAKLQEKVDAVFANRKQKEPTMTDNKSPAVAPESADARQAAQPAESAAAKQESTRDVPRQPRVPVYEDAAKQAELVAKYSWVIPGSFRKDPEKQTGTIADIKCQKCGNSRTVHCSDIFLVKLCKGCKTVK